MVSSLIIGLVATLANAGSSASSVDTTSLPLASASGKSGTVELQWRLCPECDGFEVLRSSSSQGPWHSLGKLGRVHGLSDTGLVDNTLYFYRVAGLRGGVDQAFSDVLQAITQSKDTLKKGP